MSSKIIEIVWLTAVLFSLAQSGRVKRVVGGTEVSCGIQPRVASLQNNTNGQHLCGAVILTEDYALTAAHCVQYEADEYILQLNNYCVNDTNYKHPKIPVLDVITHELYDKISGAHDISLLRIDGDLNDATWIKNEILPRSTFGVTGECTIYGYGYKDVNTKETYETLSAAKVKIMSLDECTQTLGPYIAPKYDSGMICAVGDGVDSCKGDSGGPLICDGKLQGISSYGLDCAVEGVPGVYASIGPHLHWIRKIINE